MSIIIKYITNIKNTGCILNAFTKLNLAISNANFVPEHAGQSIPNFSLIEHIGIKYIYFDFKNM